MSLPNTFLPNSFLKQGFLRRNKFEFNLTVPNILQNYSTGGFGNINSVMNENVVSVRTPPRSNDIERAPFRITFGVANNELGGQIDVVFYENQDQLIRNFFYTWINLEVEWKNDLRHVARRYFDDIKSPELQIRNYRTDNTLSTTKEIFRDVVPISIDGVDHDFEQLETNQIVKTTVTLFYRYHEIIKTRI